MTFEKAFNDSKELIKYKTWNMFIKKDFIDRCIKMPIYFSDYPQCKNSFGWKTKNINELYKESIRESEVKVSNGQPQRIEGEIILPRGLDSDI